MHVSLDPRPFSLRLYCLRPRLQFHPELQTDQDHFVDSKVGRGHLLDNCTPPGIMQTQQHSQQLYSPGYAPEDSKKTHFL